MNKTDELVRQIATVADFMDAHGIALPGDLPKHIDAIKTVGHFTRVMRRAVLDFYRGDIDAFEFISVMLALVEDQLTRAWNEGMRELELDPKLDMKPEWEVVLAQKIGEQEEYILPLAEAIEKARGAGTPIDPLYARVDLWANRYNDVKNLAKTTCGSDQKLVWRLGRTELHCGTCATLDGVVAYTTEWRDSGYKPQNAPNPLLECGGWRCDCSLVPTKKYRTRGGIPKI
jgi:hypothetical protein